MRFSVAIQSHRRRHIYDPFDQLRLLNASHRPISPLKFGARQPVPILQRRNRWSLRLKGRGSCGNGSHSLKSYHKSRPEMPLPLPYNPASFTFTPCALSVFNCTTFAVLSSLTLSLWQSAFLPLWASFM